MVSIPKRRNTRLTKDGSDVADFSYQNLEQCPVSQLFLFLGFWPPRAIRLK